ncbi:protein FAM200C-like [Parasteatoda tepidariorum]|uniref:protein FAM200C-like n=1 Tax=Parasteatoda tepidariorum TaxID=114398 RepID=UPI001C725528|nr:zinc finger MYM-type protein 6-like [Parasteatoda tepidariorum]
MAEDVEVSLCKLLISNEFSLQVDESTLPCNVGFIVSVGPVCKDTKGKSILDTVKDYFTEKNIPTANIISIATDGANAMLSRHRVFIALLKREILDILAVYCMLHRQHLKGKNLSDRLHQSLQYVMSAVNKIHSNALND